MVVLVWWYFIGMLFKVKVNGLVVLSMCIGTFIGTYLAVLCQSMVSGTLSMG